MKELLRLWNVHYCKDHSQKEYKCSFKTWQLDNGKLEHWIIENDKTRVVSQKEGNDYFLKLKSEFMYKFIVVKVVDKMGAKRKSYVNVDEVNITVKKIREHYDFMQGAELLQACDVNELNCTKDEIREQFQQKGLYVNFVDAR